MSGLDISILIYNLLNVPEVLSTLGSGEVYRFNRPINSRERDIIIAIPEYNSDRFTSAYISRGFVDINIHVPNLHLEADQTSPDLATMKLITDAVLSRIKSTDDVTLDVRIPGVPLRDADGQWFCNIRIGFFAQDPRTSQNITLIDICGCEDGYGGYTPCLKPTWSGKGTMLDPVKGSQMDMAAGKFRMEMEVDWIVPEESVPSKGNILMSDYGEFVVRGIVPENGFLRLNTKMKDGKECICPV